MAWLRLVSRRGEPQCPHLAMGEGERLAAASQSVPPRLKQVSSDAWMAGWKIHGKETANSRMSNKECRMLK
jgi:hypothetical protein